MSFSINIAQIVELRLTVLTGENHFKAEFAESLRAYPHAIQGRIVKEEDTTVVAIRGFQADMDLVAADVVRMYPATVVEYGPLTEATDFQAVIIEQSRPNTMQGSSGEIAHALPTGPSPPPYTFTDRVWSLPRAVRKVVPGKESTVLVAVAAAGADVTTSAANLGATVFVNRKETVSVLKRWWNGQDEFDEQKILAEWRAWEAARTMGESARSNRLALELEERKLALEERRLELEWKKEENKADLEKEKEENKADLEKEKLKLEEKLEKEKLKLEEKLKSKAEENKADLEKEKLKLELEKEKLKLEVKKLELEEKKVKLQEAELEFQRVQADRGRDLKSKFATIRQFPPRPRSH